MKTQTDKAEKIIDSEGNYTCAPLLSRNTDTATIAGAEYALEQLIDKHSLAVIAEMIGEICDGKAQHIQENWQDNETCKPWERAAKQFHKLYNKLEV